MVDRQKEKIGRVFTPEEAADYLRQMADALDQGRIKLDETEWEVEGSVQVKGALKSKRGKTSLKLRLRFEPMESADEPGDDVPSDGREKSAEEPEDPGSLPYKKLKKRMSRKVREIRSHIKEERIPSLAEVESFYQYCLAMTGHPGKGDEYYESFNTAAEQMMVAGRSGDLAGLAQALEVLVQMRKDCHSRFK